MALELFGAGNDAHAALAVLIQHLGAAACPAGVGLETLDLTTDLGMQAVMDWLDGAEGSLHSKARKTIIKGGDMVNARTHAVALMVPKILAEKLGIEFKRHSLAAQCFVPMLCKGTSFEGLPLVDAVKNCLCGLFSELKQAITGGVAVVPDQQFDSDKRPIRCCSNHPCGLTDRLCQNKRSGILFCQYCMHDKSKYGNFPVLTKPRRQILKRPPGVSLTCSNPACATNESYKDKWFTNTSTEAGEGLCYCCNRTWRTHGRFPLAPQLHQKARIARVCGNHPCASTDGVTFDPESGRYFCRTCSEKKLVDGVLPVLAAPTMCSCRQPLACICAAIVAIIATATTASSLPSQHQDGNASEMMAIVSAPMVLVAVLLGLLSLETPWCLLVPTSVGTARTISRQIKSSQR